MFFEHKTCVLTFNLIILMKRIVFILAFTLMTGYTFGNNTANDALSPKKELNTNFTGEVIRVKSLSLNKKEIYSEHIQFRCRYESPKTKGLGFH